MNTKLTLNINKSVILNAKTYAQERKTSVSRLVENFLNTLSIASSDETKKTPITQELLGVIKGVPLERANDERYNYLMKKYS